MREKLEYDWRAVNCARALSFLFFTLVIFPRRCYCVGKIFFCACDKSHPGNWLLWRNFIVDGLCRFREPCLNKCRWFIELSPVVRLDCMQMRYGRKKFYYWRYQIVTVTLLSIPNYCFISEAFKRRGFFMGWRFRFVFFFFGLVLHPLWFCIFFEFVNFFCSRQGRLLYRWPPIRKTLTFFFFFFWTEAHLNFFIFEKVFLAFFS